MKEYKIVFSVNPPNVRDVIWAEPKSNGFSLKLFNGTWIPLKVDGAGNVSAKINTSEIAETIKADVKKEIIGSVQDNEIDLTLWGLKKYVDAKFAALSEKADDTVSDTK